MRSGYRPNTKSGGVAIYHKDHLTVIRWNSIEEIIVLEIRLGNNKCLYNNFCSTVYMLMPNINEKLLTYIITGDFITK